MRLDEEVALTLFRTIQEGLHNVVKHSRAQHVRVELSTDDREIHICLSDDGVGFETEGDRNGGLGLISMRERLRLIGGFMRIDSAPSQGTTVNIWAPVGESHRNVPAKEEPPWSCELGRGNNDESRTGTLS